MTPTRREPPKDSRLAGRAEPAADEVDVDLRELQGQERLDVFCDFLREIGRRLGKPALMEPEGDDGHPVIGFDVEADRVVPSQSRRSGDCGRWLRFIEGSIAEHREQHVGPAAGEAE